MISNRCAWDRAFIPFALMGKSFSAFFSFVFLLQVRDKVCCAANRLFRDLLKNLDMKEKSLMQDQVLTSVVPLLLNMYNPHPEVAQVTMEAAGLYRTLTGVFHNCRTR